MSAPEKIREQAALYALGMLEGDELAEFESLLAAGDETALAELAGSQDATASLAWSAPARPRPEIKQRVLRRASVAALKGLGAIRANEGKWRQSPYPGVTYKKVFFDPTIGLVTLLVRLEPGARYPAHIHSRTEQCLVLEGDLRHDGNEYGPGDFTWAEAGSVDPDLYTQNGTLLLLLTAPENEVVQL